MGGTYDVLGSGGVSFPFPLLLPLPLAIGAGVALEEAGPEGVPELFRRSALGPVGALGTCFACWGCARRSAGGGPPPRPLPSLRPCPCPCPCRVSFSGCPYLDSLSSST